MCKEHFREEKKPRSYVDKSESRNKQNMTNITKVTFKLQSYTLTNESSLNKNQHLVHKKFRL